MSEADCFALPRPAQSFGQWGGGRSTHSWIRHWWRQYGYSKTLMLLCMYIMSSLHLIVFFCAWASTSRLLLNVLIIIMITTVVASPQSASLIITQMKHVYTHRDTFYCQKKTTNGKYNCKRYGRLPVRTRPINAGWPPLIMTAQRQKQTDRQTDRQKTHFTLKLLHNNNMYPLTCKQNSRCNTRTTTKLILYIISTNKTTELHSTR